MTDQGPVNPSHETFERFVQAQKCKDVRNHFAELCRQLDINPKDFRTFYGNLKERLNYWKAKALWTKLDKRASHADYQQGKVCMKNKVVILKFILYVFGQISQAVALWPQGTVVLGFFFYCIFFPAINQLELVICFLGDCQHEYLAMA